MNGTVFPAPATTGMQTNGFGTTSITRELFLSSPASEAYNLAVEDFRSTEYPQLNNVTYLDHAGTTLYSSSLITQVSADLLGNLYGNPHSQSLSSLHTSKRIDDVRLRVLRLFNADPKYFDIVFVANATAGMKLVVEALNGYTVRRNRKKGGNWGGGDGWKYWYHADSHTSLVGVRECADEAGGGVLDDDQAVQEWIDGTDGVDGMDVDQDLETPPTLGLFAWPAQSNFSGRRTPRHWAGEVRAKKKNIYTLLDAAALVTTAPLDLSDPTTSPDFTVLSFYKMFGYPDLGCLIVHRDTTPLFQSRLYFGGGTVEAVISRTDAQHRFHAKRKPIHQTLEDGTLPFHSILALDSAIATHTRLFTSFSHISSHTLSLAAYLYTALDSIRHSNGTRLVSLYSGPPSATTQGAILTFNLLRPDGTWVGYTDVEKLAAVKNIHIRTGGLCNPGGIEKHVGLEAWEVKSNYDAGHRCWDERDIVRGKPTGAIRVSLGAMTTWADVERFRGFVEEHYKDKRLVAGSWGRRDSMGVEGGAAKRFSWMGGGSGAAKGKGVRVEIGEIVVYPIKSCAGFEVPKGERWELMETGLRYDREWCLVHLGTNRALDQKRFPRMALIKTTISLTSGTLTITTPPLDSEGPEGTAKELTISISELYNAYTSPCPTRLCGEAITTDNYTTPFIISFFSTFLDTPCTLARHSKNTPTRTFQAHTSLRHRFNNKRALPDSGDEEAASEPEPKTPITLANESPLLLSTEASLSSLSALLPPGPSPELSALGITPRTFRANLHLLTPSPSPPLTAYQEEQWTSIIFDSGTHVKILGKCKRCRMIAVDQDLGGPGERSAKVYEVVSGDRGGYWGVLGGVRSVGWVRVGEGGWAA